MKIDSELLFIPKRTVKFGEIEQQGEIHRVTRFCFLLIEHQYQCNQK